MAIVVVKDGAIKPVTRIYRKQGSVWKECLLVQVRRTPLGGTPELVTVFDRYLTPPTGLRGVSATHNSGQMAWNATPQATDYQVLQRPASNPSATPTILPSSGTWTSELSLNAVGLAQNSSYRFTVQARRIKADGEELISPESNAITLYTGYPSTTNANPGYPGTWLNYIYPSRSDSYTSDYGWGGSSGGPDVIQGHPTSAGGTNHRGAVAYNTAHQQLDAIVAPYGLVGTSEGVTIVDARIERIHRRGQGSGTPNLYFYNARVDFSGPPSTAGGASTIAAPATNGDRFDVNPAGLLSWVRSWSQFQLYAPQNGLVIFRSDGSGNATNGFDGYCVLQNAVGDVWRLKIWLQWAITVPGAAPTWSG